ncbi:hypothetical protein [Nocardioides bizhenqiangii]|uniref:Alpha/beta hydrolase n=1 Tax=Nocardioides bizhenqiangii TaxID=3095076 RepID=A0ABZ0ZRW5_9ACTN|nr:hypothetical protein [Nocardioides sp. HM61]WQQ26820.1 hypothetical protein SHK19_00975 [Nocardioides sp. HM61]
MQATDAGLRQVAAAAALQPTATDPPTVTGTIDAADTLAAARTVLSQAAVEPPQNSINASVLRAVTTAAGLLAKELASVALGEDTADLVEDRQRVESGTGPHPPSTIVHGTGAYVGTWWTPRGDFHEFIRGTINPDLYSNGQYFQWSGKYSARHRDVAAQRLLDWAAPYDGRIRRLFAHSYGGVIALRALGLGLKVEDLVLLSTPAERVETNWSAAGRIRSLRIHVDLVLLTARRRQIFDLPVAEFHLPKWFVGHSDSRAVDVWQQHDVARILELT